MGPPLPVGATEQERPWACHLIARVSRRSSTALMLGRPRSLAVEADCPLEDSPYRTNQPLRHRLDMCARTKATRPACGHAPALRHERARTRTAGPVGVEDPTGGATLGQACDADADQPSPPHGHLPLDVRGRAMGGAVRQTARPDVGLFVGLFRQPTSGFGRFVAVPSRTTESAESPVNKGNPRKQLDAGGGTRTPDTRIMIPLL